ncbi:binding--dependent transport system inner membrane component family protein [Candidatus Endolissoclinum faulkneri L2]|uniref:Binding--dependent transport system inner membrane component family protein n=1 Tax=Candidatus Endolissoclinum faulkneri L2 TaxID=1193729 RepID=K7YHL5_9PROT|nr:sugar ABC transporter permease [Candidatus Endolissoclinum faulkneri]AFX99070.1 binding--dependent transport system inner membrane component family protein [Candidatus Endolissoclinum faulkneri L2]
MEQRLKSEDTKLSYQKRKVYSAWLLLLPMLVVLLIVAIWPLCYTFFYAFTDASLSTLTNYSFIGFDNFLVQDNGCWYGLVADPLWWYSVWNTIVFAIGSVVIEILLGTIIALVMHTKFIGCSLFRAAMLIPWAIPTVVSAKIWNWMLHDQFGVIDYILVKLQLIANPISWLADHNLTMLTVILVDSWKTAPFVAMLVLAALQMLPNDCYEAAKVDGVHPIKVFFGITLPLIRPALIVAVLFRLIEALRIFDVVYIMTGSAESTMTMSVYARQNLVNFQDLGYGSAASTMLFIVIFFIIAPCLAIMRVDVMKEVH